MLIFFAFDNNDMESSKRCVSLSCCLFIVNFSFKMYVEIDGYQKYILQRCRNAKAAIEVRCDPTFFSFFFLARYIRILRVHIKSKYVVLEIKVISV